jgi:hypothetical protein
MPFCYTTPACADGKFRAAVVIRVLATCWESSVGVYILASHKAKKEIPGRCRLGRGRNVTLD